MAMEGITPVMNIDRNCGDGYGMNGGAWIFGLIVLASLFNGGFGGFGNRCGNGESSILEAVNLSNGQQTAQLEAAANQRENCSQFTATNSNITNGFSNLARDLCSQSFGIVNTITGGNADIKDRLATMSAQNAQCCCDIQRGIDGINYNNAINTASINANTTAQIQKVLDTLCADKIAAQQARISQLELNQALCGVVRYPTQATFNAGYPFGYHYGFNGCGCNNNL